MEAVLKARTLLEGHAEHHPPTPRTGLIDAVREPGQKLIPDEIVARPGRRHLWEHSTDRRGSTPDAPHELPWFRRRRLLHEGRVRRPADGPARGATDRPASADAAQDEDLPAAPSPASGQRPPSSRRRAAPAVATSSARMTPSLRALEPIALIRTPRSTRRATGPPVRGSTSSGSASATRSRARSSRHDLADLRPVQHLTVDPLRTPSGAAWHPARPWTRLPNPPSQEPLFVTIADDRELVIRDRARRAGAPRPGDPPGDRPHDPQG